MLRNKLGNSRDQWASHLILALALWFVCLMMLVISDILSGRDLIINHIGWFIAFVALGPIIGFILSLLVKGNQDRGIH